MSSPARPGPSERRPLSVVAFGNSVAAMVMKPHRPSGDAGLASETYLEVLTDRLAAAGVQSQPHLEALWFDFLHRGLRDYERRVRNHTPDVLIVQYGLNEMQPWLVPVWLIRHLLKQGWAVTRPARAYRTRVATPFWRQVRRFRRWASPHVGTRTWQTTPRRFAGHLEVLIRMVRAQSRPLVLVLDVNPPGEVLEHFLSGMKERHAIYQNVIADVVASFGSEDVRLVQSSAVCDELGAAALPDGMHMSAEAHRLLGERLAHEVFDWLERGGRGWR